MNATILIETSTVEELTAVAAALENMNVVPDICTNVDGSPDEAESENHCTMHCDIAPDENDECDDEAHDENDDEVGMQSIMDAEKALIEYCENNGYHLENETTTTIDIVGCERIGLELSTLIVNVKATPERISSNKIRLTKNR